ncbi:sigma-70 family RNA polymerase sigma factor [bacterium]|nr:sigma-70 family RNA polymerase sigma factor [bacterium]
MSKEIEEKPRVFLLSMSETDLVEQARAGDVGAFDRLMSLHQDRVFALAYRILCNMEDAADVQQETFVRAWRFLHKFRGEAGFSTWLHRITVNLCLSKKRRIKPDLVSFDDDLIECSVDIRTYTCADRVATAMVVRNAMAQLPANYMAVIVLREIEERPFEEIARILGCSVGSARVRCCKARKLLRDKLEACLKEEDQ